jgi:hypothetical protein
VNTNKLGENIKDNTEIPAKDSPGYYELKQHNPWFDEGYSKLSDKRNQAKLQSF